MHDSPPSGLRRVGPMLVLAGLMSGAFSLINHVPHPPVGVAAGMLLIAALFFPPGRHRHRATYDGTIWSVKLALFLIVAGFCGQFVSTFLAGLFAGLRAALVTGHQVTATPEFTAAMLLAATVSTVAAAGVAVMILRLTGREWWALGLQGEGLVGALWVGVQSGLVLAGFKLMYFKLLQTLGVWQLDGAGPVQVMFALDEPLYLIGGLVMGAVLVPIAEEILFRGVLFAALRRQSGPVPAAILSSVLFGLLHYPDMVFPGMLGLTFSLLYHRTGTLWAPIGAHMLVNSITLGLSFAHGSLTQALSWTAVGTLIVLVALAQLAAIWLAPSAAAESCACGQAAKTAGARCVRCSFPLDAWPLWATGSLRFVSAVLLVGLGAACYSAGWFIAQPYAKGRPTTWLGMQYNLLKNGNNPAAETLLAAWAKDDPDSPEVFGFRLSEAYRVMDYPLVVKLVESRHKEKVPKFSAQEKNMLSLALAEMGGVHLARAVQLGEEAVKAAPVGVRAHYEDTLGWAYLRAGQLEDARELLDRDPSIYGGLSKDGMAEICYHRGVVLWALDDTKAAIPVLETAARMGEDGKPFSHRAAAILSARQLPAGLVPETSR